MGPILAIAPGQVVDLTRALPGPLQIAPEFVQQARSHFHFAEVNTGLELDRQAAWGQRLDIPAGTSVRFEPGIEREVELVPLAGARVVPGLRGLAGGSLDLGVTDQPPRRLEDASG